MIPVAVQYMLFGIIVAAMVLDAGVNMRENACGRGFLPTVHAFQMTHPNIVGNEDEE